jgi:pilus assembly protein Flp/PilA
MLDFLQYGIVARVQSAFYAVRDREDGQALVEYALILALVSVVSIAILTTLGLNVQARLTSVANAL